jgi:hypothetical protein
MVLYVHLYGWSGGLGNEIRRILVFIYPDHEDYFDHKGAILSHFGRADGQINTSIEMD